MSFLASMTKNKGSIAVAAVASIALIGGGVWWFHTKSHPVPQRTQAAVSNPAKPSTIVLPVKASLADIQARLNKEVPTTLFAVDETMECVPAQMAKVCVIPNIFTGGCSQWVKTYVSPAISCHLKGSVTRGNISISGAGNTLNLANARYCEHHREKERSARDRRRECDRHSRCTG